MIETRSSRLVALGCLLLALFGASIGFGMLTPNPQAGRYPGSVDIAYHTDAYIGERVVVSGTVVRTEPVVIRAEYTFVRDGRVSRDTLRITVTDVAIHPDRGATMQVYGTLTTSRTVRAINTVVVPARNQLYMYAISFVAGLWVLGRLLRQWRPDWGALRVVPRPAPLDIRAVLRAWLPSTEEDSTDA